MGSILDKYREQVKLDEQNQNNDTVDGRELTEEQRKEYEKVLNDLRHNQNSMETQYQKKMSEMKKMTEEEMEKSDMIKVNEKINFYVKHAFCEECGEELISNAPPLFNPFTLEKICKHTCTKCGKAYNFEFAYPRLVIEDNNGKEIPAFLR